MRDHDRSAGNRRLRFIRGLALVVAVLTAVTLGTAGQVAAAVRVVPFETRAADGTMLRGDVYLPETGGPVATVLQLSPYWNTVKGPGELQASSTAVQPFLEAGFAVALVNLRGTGGSDGCFQWGSRLDWSDASTVVTALAAQPWSNGNVGMYGTSYEGWSQYMAMADPPPALKAVVPISGVIDVWSLLTRQGAPISVGPVASTVFGAATSFAGLEPAVVGHAGCSEYVTHLREGIELVTTGDRTPYYQQRDLRPLLADSPVPVLMVNGLRYVDEGHTLQFEDLWTLLRKDRTRFMLGQWGHGGVRPDFIRLAVGWFDHYLRGGPQVTAPGIVEYQDDASGWHTAPSWPPAAESVPLYLSGQELIATRNRVTPSQRSFLSLDLDAAALTSATGAVEDRSGRGRGLACGPQQLVYVSPPLAQEILVAGNFSADLTVSSDLPGGNLVATLYHTAGQGSCPELVGGARNSGRIQLDLRHWQQPGVSRPFPTSTPTRVTATSLPLATVIPAGHRLVLAIGATSAEILPDPLKPTITVATGDQLPGSLSLPVVAGKLQFR
ncbi:MAG TPA: CocE/NonD family hydrolase [Pseudonocardiaceae bacterium]|nr:CocE/NonD family hydrolase [Pseudonocardiaceae bacterium]